MPVKIGFQVVSSTGEDEGFRASELNYHGPTVRGWRSSVNCTFPQEIILQLKVLAILHQIQILAHQYLIPHKIEICTSTRLDNDKGYNSHDLFEYLGFITFSDNKATGFRSRELKSIVIPSKKARYIKLRIHDNHLNVKNINNQVGLMAVNVLGDEMEGRDSGWEVKSNGCKEGGISGSSHLSNLNYLSPYDDLAFEMSVDEETAKIMKMIEWKMLQAVFEERLDYANALNITLENLRAAGEILGIYEQEKRKAIILEDFDKAKSKKFQIHHFRQKIYTTLRIDRIIHDADEYHIHSNADDSTPLPTIPTNLTHSQSQTFPHTPLYFHHLPPFTSSASNPHIYHHLKQTPPTIPEVDHTSRPSFDHSGTPSSLEDSLEGDESSLPRTPEKLSTRPAEPVGECWKNGSPPRYELKTSVREQKVRGKAKSSFEAYEDRMVPALRSYHGNEVVRECQLGLAQQRKSKLNEREKKQAMLPIGVFGIEMIEKFYSKSFNDKEEGLKQLQEELKKAMEEKEEGQPPSYNKMGRAAIFLLHRGLRDTVYSVYKLAAETVRMFFAEFVPQRMSSAEVARSVEKLLPELLTKSGDVTPRIYNLAAHTLLSMAECEDVRRLNIIPAHLSRPLTSSVHPRLALSRVEMVEQLILNHGISKEKKSGLTCRTLAEFGSSGLHHPAEAVRKVSERILIEVYKVNPRIVRKQLPPDDNVTRRNLLYRQLFQEFDLMDTERKVTDQTMDDSTTAFQTDSRQTQQRPQTHANHQSPPNPPPHQLTRITPNFNSHLHPHPLNLFLPPTAPKGRTSTEKHPPRKHPQHNPHTINGGSALKFPPLTHPINTITHTTKPTPKPNSTDPTQQKSHKGTPSLTSSLTRRETKRDKSSSSIPVATFGQRRKQTVAPCKETEQRDVGGSLGKAKEGLPQTVSHKSIRIRMFDSGSDLKGGKGKGHEKESEAEKETEMEESVKLSESMLASIRENELTMSSLFGEEEKPKTCIFCLSPKQWMNEDSLNKHYLKECLMLTTCEYCMEVTEISGLSNHLLDDCKWKNIFEKCLDCEEAILRDLYNKHECSALEGKVHKSRCPFCHKEIGLGESSWRKHLMGNKTCPNHPRQNNMAFK